jgi:hypothetical protein
MSLDITLNALIPARIGEVMSENCTHNLAPMWRKAGVYDALYMSDGRRAGDYLEALKAGLADMEENPAEYKKLNPPNGWGDYEGAIGVLQRITRAFEEYPDGKIWISK